MIPYRKERIENALYFFDFNFIYLCEMELHYLNEYGIFSFELFEDFPQLKKLNEFNSSYFSKNEENYMHSIKGITDLVDELSRAERYYIEQIMFKKDMEKIFEYF